MQAWEAFLREQESLLGKETVRKWLRSLRVIHFDACNLYLEARDSFQAIWFEEHIRSKVLHHLVNGNNRKIRVHLTVAHHKEEDSADQPTAYPPQKEENAPPFSLQFDTLNPHARFETYLSLEKANLPYRLLKALVTPEEEEIQWGSFNPIYLHGPPGAGKTHLFMSVAHAAEAQGLRTLYVRGERFTEHVISAIRRGEMRLFRGTYRHVDLFILDGVESLARKAATQEELFHTFNALHEGNKQILLSGLSAPGALQGIEPRLVSRFEWGLTLPIAPPPSSLWGRMLLKRAEMIGYPLSPEVAHFLVESFPSNTHRLLRGFEALALRAHLDSGIGASRPLSITESQRLIADLMEQEKEEILSPEKIIDAVARYYGIHPKEILSKSQRKEYSNARQIAMYLCRTSLELPFKKIGEIFERDHSTVMTSVNKIQEELKGQEEELSHSVNAINRELRAGLTSPRAITP